MNHYNYQKTLKAVWEKAVDLYRSGNTDASTYFNEEEAKFLSSIGANSHEIFDFAEDFVDGGADGSVRDPYKLLPKLFADASDKDYDLLSEGDELGNGGAALSAYGRMQFT